MIDTKTHAHEFKKGRSGTMETCYCGRFRNVVSEENPAIVERLHTPTPWAVVEGVEVWGPGKTTPLGTHVADCIDGNESDNAAFIVRAVNAHDALVEALTLAYAALRDPNTRHLSHDGRGITETIKDALAKAETKGV